MSQTQTGMRAHELTALLDSIEDYAIFLLGPDGEIRSWNSGARRTMGYDADEVIGSHFSRFYPPEDLATDKPGRELDTARRYGRVEDEGWRVRRDGTRFWVNTVISALRDPSGRTIGFAKVTRDMTRRREAEESLRRSEEIFRLLVASVKDYAIFLLDPGGHVLTWNEGARRLKGYEPPDIIGKHFSIFYPPETKETKPPWELEVARRDGSVEDEGWRVRKDGTRFWANVIITAVFDEHRQLRGYAKVTRDMTERKRAEETQAALLAQREATFQAEEERRRAESAYRIAQETNRAKDGFLMTLSHELRTPLTAILGWSRLLTSMSPDDPTFNDALNAIGRSAQIQARLIDDVLDVSRIVSGKLRLTVEDVDIARVLSAAIDAVRPSADAKGIALTTSFAHDLGTVAADATRLQQIVWNLLSNSVKFTGRDGVISLAANRTASNVHIIVSDTGEGIDPNFLPHIFEPFRQGENPTTRIHGGLGLGLSIVRYLVEAHGGTVAVESKGRGTGTKFTVALPLGASTMDTAKAPPPIQTTAAQPLLEKLAGAKILLVDDDPDGRGLVSTVLRRAGAEVVEAPSAPDALEKLAKARPDIVVSDIALPEIDGYQLSKQIRAQYPGLKIVALTAFPRGRAAEDEAGFDAYILKPVEPGDLVDAVAKALGR